MMAGNDGGNDLYKKPVPNKDLKKIKDDAPSWAKQYKPYVTEDGKAFAKR
jgi:hypothetical protein